MEFFFMGLLELEKLYVLEQLLIGQMRALLE
jgi:hypothetical protein